MRFGTYMIFGSVFAGICYGGYVRDHHARCPKERFELGWTVAQIAITWPGVAITALMMPKSLVDQPKRACREDL